MFSAISSAYAYRILFYSAWVSLRPLESVPWCVSSTLESSQSLSFEILNLSHYPSPFFLTPVICILDHFVVSTSPNLSCVLSIFVFLHASFLIFSFHLFSNSLNHSLAIPIDVSQDPLPFPTLTQTVIAHHHSLPYDQNFWSYYSESGFKSITMEAQDSQTMLIP